jgi:dethiobiotin synthetase
MSCYFVTATGTDIGKTYVTAGIIRAARESSRRFAAIKPLLSGFDPEQLAGSDTAILLAAMGKQPTLANIAAITPWRYLAPLSPDIAAAREHRRIDFNALVGFCEAAIAASPETLLIEGVGGVAVPLDSSHLVADWVSALRMPAILVAGTYLGTISHTITAAETLATRGVAITAIVLSESPDAPMAPKETAESLKHYLPIPVHIIPRDVNEASFRLLVAAL